MHASLLTIVTKCHWVKSIEISIMISHANKNTTKPDKSTAEKTSQIMSDIKAYRTITQSDL